MAELSGDKSVTSELAARLDAVRGEVEAAMNAAREQAAARLGAAPSRGRVDTLLAASRRRVDDLLGGRGNAAPASGALTITDLHTLERLLSHVRHSVVRVCFYNLKLFCPSLVDEFDANVAGQVATNLRQLPTADEEIRAFFAQRLSAGRTVGEQFPELQKEAARELDALAAAARALDSRMDDEAARRAFATDAPKRIDAVMAALGKIQTQLEAEKIVVPDLLREAAELAHAEAENAGINVEVQVQACPRVFGDARRLLAVFLELIHNALKYSKARNLLVRAAPSADKLWVEVSFEDDGRGMPPELLETCVARGVSTGGTGEGLPMAVTVVEVEHMGQFRMETAAGGGCRAMLRLPVKLQLAGRRDRSQA